MKIFLDTANIEDIRKYNDMGLLDGITTNPTLLAKEGGDPHAAMKEITDIIKGDVSLEVVSTDYDGMMEEGKKLREYGDFKTQILVASVRHPQHVVDAAKIGADVVTLPAAVLGKMLGHSLTDKGLKAFLSDWEKLQSELSNKE